jgi:hypothetical protein
MTSHFFVLEQVSVGFQVRILSKSFDDVNELISSVSTLGMDLRLSHRSCARIC